MENHKANYEVQRDPRWKLVDRIAASPHLKASLRLQEFLFYISECAIREVPGEATEQQIGMHVFHRHPGYNSSEDSIVRTHARLLRQKLTAYFANEGSDEEIIVDVPKGHYLPIFTSRTLDIATSAPTTHAEERPLGMMLHSSVEAQEITATPTRFRRWAFLAVTTVLLTVVGMVAWHPWKKMKVPQSPVDTFWRPFFTHDPPFVVYSNAVFTGNSITGLRYAPAGAPQDGSAPDSYVDTYTGIGELSAVYDLTKLFDTHQATFTLKRSQLVAWDEAKSRNLIFIGASIEN